MQFHEQSVPGSLIDGIAEELVFQKLALLRDERILLYRLEKDWFGLFGWNPHVVCVPAIGGLGLDRHGVPPITIKPRVNHAVPIRKRLHLDARPRRIIGDVWTGEHAHDTNVLHEEGGHAGLVEGLTREAIHLAGFYPCQVLQNSPAKPRLPELLVASLYPVDRGRREVL